MVNGLKGVAFENLVFLSHTDCAAFELHDLYENIRLEKGQSVMEDLGNQRTLLGQLKDQYQTEMRHTAYFGVIDTEKAIRVTEETPLEIILSEVITWVDNIAPPKEIFGER